MTLPIPPDPTPDPNAFIVTCEYFAESSLEHGCLLGISFSPDATVTVVNGAGELLIRGEDYDFFEDEEGLGVVFVFNDDGAPSKYTITIEGEIVAVSASFFSRNDENDINTFEIISFGGIQAEADEETGLHTLILDVTDITAIRSWAGLHNIDAIVLSDDFFLETLPNSLAPLAHMKRVIFDLVLVRNGALTGYEEFAQNKEYFQFTRCPFWKGDVRRFASALDAAGFDPMQVVMSTVMGVFESAMSAKNRDALPLGGDIAGIPVSPYGSFMELFTLPLIYLYERAVAGECIQILGTLAEGFFTKVPIASGGGPVVDGRYVLMMSPLLPGFGEADTRVYDLYFTLCTDTFMQQ